MFFPFNRQWIEDDNIYLLSPTNKYTLSLIIKSNNFINGHDLMLLKLVEKYG